MTVLTCGTPCPPCAIADFICAYPCRKALTVAPSDGTAAVAVAEGAYSRVSLKTVADSAFMFRPRDVTFRLHTSEYADTNSPPLTVTENDTARIWTVVDAQYSYLFCQWRVTARNLETDLSWGSIEIGELSYAKDADGAQVRTIAWTEVPGVIIDNGAYASDDDNQTQTETQVEILLDPAAYPTGTDWSKYRFRDVGETRVYKMESKDRPEIGEPLTISGVEDRA